MLFLSQKDWKLGCIVKVGCHLSIVRCINEVHPVNEYASRQHMIARLKVEAVFL